MSQLGPYSTSSALSTTHYKLVQSLESARSPTEQHSHLSSCLSKTRYSWSRTQPKPTQAYHDLIWILYCHSQRSQSFKSEEERELWEGEWIKLGCVRLAGGPGSVKQRELGYRACIELFPFSDGSHSLKLLLINSIRSDLYAERGSSKAEQRWMMALTAIASENLVTMELIPTVEDRVFELLKSEEESTATRKLALQALKTLVKFSSAQKTDHFSTLLIRARQTILELLTPAHFSSSAKPPHSRSRPLHSSLLQSTSSRPSSSILFDPSSATRLSRTKKPLPFTLQLSLISHLSPSSPLHPLIVDRSDRLQMLLPILRRFTTDEEKQDGESRKTRWMGSRMKQVWGLSRTLEVIEDVLKSQEKEQGSEDGFEVKSEIIEELERILEELSREEDGENVRGMKNALILSLLRLFPLISPSISYTILKPLLAYLKECLLLSILNPRHPDPILQLFVLQSLALLPPSSWTGGMSEAEGQGKGKQKEQDVGAGWHEESWRAILSGLGSRDENVRRATIHLISLVDTKLLELHYSQLLTSLPDSSNRSDALSNLFPLLLEIFPYLSSSSPPRPSASFWTSRRLPLPSQLAQLLDNPSLSLESTSVIPSLVLTILNDFRYHSLLLEQREFADGLWQIGSEEQGFEEEVKGWKGNVMMGLLMAGTVHRSAKEDEEEGEGDRDRVRRVLELADWLGDDRVAEELKEMLTEPFLFALLRILSLSINHEPSSTFDPIHQLDQVTDSLANLSESPTFLAGASGNRELLGIALEATRTSENLYKLHRIGMETRDQSLAEFGESLFTTFRSSASSLPPRSTSVARQSVNGGIERSVAAMRRERNDLRRERSDRGGVVSSDEKVESLMTPKEDHVDLPREGAGDDEDGEEEDLRRAREMTGSTQDGNEQQPPTNLLIELTENLDPFHVH